MATTAVHSAGLFQQTFDASSIPSKPDYEFRCTATVDTKVLETSKVIGVDNDGPIISFSAPTPNDGSFGFSNSGTTTMTVAKTGGTTPTRIEFFYEHAVVGGIVSTSFSVTNSPTFPISVAADVSALFVGLPVTIKAVALDSAGRQGFATFSGTVSEPNFAPTNIALSTSTVLENSALSTFIGALTTTDPNTGNTHTYTITSGSDIVTVIGANLVVNGDVNYEASATKSITIRSTDGGGLSFDKSFTLSITDVNEPPTAMTLSTSTVPENTGTGTTIATLSVTNPETSQTITYTLLNSASGRFSLSGSSLKVLGELDFETQTTRTIQVRALDNGASAQFVDASFTINIQDINEPPTLISLSSSSIAEQCTETGCTAQTLGIKVGDLTTADPETSNTHTYTLLDNGGGRFQISGSELQLATTSLDFEATPQVTIQVRSTDNGSPAKSKDQYMIVAVIDIAEAPVVSGSTCSIQENKPDDTFVCTVAATNTQDDVALKFEILSGNPGEAFKINDCSGIIFVKTGSQLDFEGGTTQYTLRIKITGGIATEIDQIINVLNVAEAPTITPTTLTVTENTAANTMIADMNTYWNDRKINPFRQL